jgi:hypothetical protein
VKPYEVIAATRGSALTPTQRHVLTHVCLRAGADGECFASVATLLEDTGFGSERTVQAALRELVALGVLRARVVPGRSTAYTVHAEAIPSAPPAPPQQLRPAVAAPHPRSDCGGPPQQVHPTPAVNADDQILDQIHDQIREQTPAEPAAPKWARGHKGTPAAEVAAAVVRCLSAIRQGPVDVQRCATDAKHVVSLQRATSTPWSELPDEVELVARWARESSDGLAQNDIRGTRRDGQQWGDDRSRVVATICVQSKWADRLDAARRWAEHATGPPVLELVTGDDWPTTPSARRISP